MNAVCTQSADVEVVVDVFDERVSILYAQILRQECHNLVVVIADREESQMLCTAFADLLSHERHQSCQIYSSSTVGFCSIILHRSQYLLLVGIDTKMGSTSTKCDSERCF